MNNWSNLFRFRNCIRQRVVSPLARPLCLWTWVFVIIELESFLHDHHCFCFECWARLVRLLLGLFWFLIAPCSIFEMGLGLDYPDCWIFVPLTLMILENARFTFADQGLPWLYLGRPGCKSIYRWSFWDLEATGRISQWPSISTEIYTESPKELRVPISIHSAQRLPSPWSSSNREAMTQTWLSWGTTISKWKHKVQWPIQIFSSASFALPQHSFAFQKSSWAFIT